MPLSPPACVECGAQIGAVTADVDPQAIGLRFTAQCGHTLPAEVAAELWKRHGYRWDTPAVTAASLAAAERVRHVTEEGYTPAHDAEHADGLAWASWAYVDAAMAGVEGPLDPPVMWPWATEGWKADATPKRRLVIAISLLMAELDRQLLKDRTPE